MLLCKPVTLKRWADIRELSSPFRASSLRGGCVFRGERIALRK